MMGEYSNQQDRNDYNISDSQSAQENFETVARELESALDRRDQDVRAAMAEYQADGVSEEYAAMEQEWNMAGAAVRQVISSIRTSLSENDDIATSAMSRARSHIPV